MGEPTLHQAVLILGGYFGMLVGGAMMVSALLMGLSWLCVKLGACK